MTARPSRKSRSKAKTDVPAKRVVRYAVVGLGHIAQAAVLPAFEHAKRNSRLVALVSGEYFGMVFDRPSAIPAIDDDSEPNTDMWATADEPADTIIGWLDTAAAEADATLAELDLTAPGHVPWWDPGEVDLHRIAVHMIAELNRHAGHADIVRELIDGGVGLRDGVSNLPGERDGVDAEWSVDYRARLLATAESFR